jgi:hypothetical protein
MNAYKAAQVVFFNYPQKDALYEKRLNLWFNFRL